jgi:hypothetical protein
MSPLAIASFAFVCVFSGTLGGMYLRSALPDHHLSDESKEVVKLGIGMIATMTALILGLMTASAKSAFDAQNAAVEHMAANVLALDRALAGYGPETLEIRTMLHQAVSSRLEISWPEESGQAVADTKPKAANAGDQLALRVVALTPKTEAQRWFQSQALGLMSDALQTRWTIFGAKGSSVQLPFIVIVVSWLALIFGSFGLFAPRNPTVVAVLLICALSVAASVFLILEMDQPFDGMMKVSSVPLRFALENLGK